MFTICEINNKENTQIQQIVDIHMRAFSGFFLTFLGAGFLRQMYSSYCEHPQSGLLAAMDESGDPVGFLAYSADLSGLYKYMIKRHVFSFGWYAFCAFLRKPAIFIRLFRAFLKPGESKRQEAYVELSSIGVSPDVMNGGVGSLLISELKKRVDFNVYRYITLETDAVDNEKANCFYQKNAFRLVRTFETPEGRKMNEYRYRG